MQERLSLITESKWTPRLKQTLRNRDGDEGERDVETIEVTN